MGAPHTLKAPCIQVLSLVADRSGAFVTDAEVLQEIMRRYLAQRAWTRGREVLTRFAELMSGRVEAVYALDVEAAVLLADAGRGLSARDLIHLAVMQRVGSTRIVTADTGFDRIEGIERLDPMLVEEWAASVGETA